MKKFLLFLFAVLLACSPRKKYPSPPHGGKVITNSLGMQFVEIPAGEFKMLGRYPVKISKPFYLSRFEVSQKQWQEVMGKNPSNFRGDCIFWIYCDSQDHPVERVSYDDIQEFIKKLNVSDPSRPRYQYCLPTEAEWEYAYRAGTTTTYYWGNEAEKAENYAWYYENSSSKTHPVGKKRPNAFGLYDMAGNVWEWVEDCYDKDFYAKTGGELSVDPVNRGQKRCSRVLRGGSWVDFDDSLAASSRGDSSSDLQGNSAIGFRLVAFPAGEP
ncbi:MAG: formylglycine-generating enzyme family protein [Leptospiraceae bacterium]|nr:formylglycine-generating enzyme family protein [Leptospiraceae bacterium]